MNDVIVQDLDLFFERQVVLWKKKVPTNLLVNQNQN